MVLEKNWPFLGMVCCDAMFEVQFPDVEVSALVQFCAHLNRECHSRKSGKYRQTLFPKPLR